MSNDLIIKLNKLLKSWEGRLLSNEEEFISLNNLLEKPTRLQAKRIKHLRSDSIQLSINIKALRNELNRYSNIDDKIKELSNIINDSDKSGVNFIMKERYDDLRLELIALESDLVDKYCYYLEVFDAPTRTRKPE